MGLNFEREDFRREAALAKEQERVAKKEAKREKMMNRSSYRIMVKTAKYMDQYYLDPLIGLIPGGVGDVLSSSLAMPFIYYSLCVVRSIPLTLAVIYNVLLDVLIGAIPFLGNVLDIFKRSYLDNLRLITGYIEDDKEIREGVEIYLKSQGYEVFQAADGVEGLEVIEKEDIHLAIVDIMMPRMDGISMVVKLREKYDFPVIFLSAKSEEVDKIMGLNMGADDYVTKPFTPLELLARVNSQLRRYRRFMEKLGDKEKTQNIHVIGGLELDEERVEVRVDGELVKVTPMEYKILLLLMKNPGRVFSADEIYERVWNERAVNTDTIMVLVRNFREKIEIYPKEP